MIGLRMINDIFAIAKQYIYALQTLYLFIMRNMKEINIFILVE